MLMEINKIEVGYLKTNCYVLKKDNDILIIDPGDEFNKIEPYLNGNVLGIIITHYHFDHIGAIEDIQKKYNVKIYDINNLNDNNTIGSFSFKMIKTPGHKSDLISLLFDNHLFCGDFIFENAIGRVDLPTGDYNQMKESIAKIIKLPKSTIIYPGHGNITSLDKEYNNLLNYLR